MIKCFFSQVSILKSLEHPNIINLVEVIDDQKSDYLYMGTDSLFHCFEAFVSRMSQGVL